jgi:hypothetical protein
MCPDDARSIRDDHRDMTYAVLWRSGCGPAHAGKLSLLEHSLLLEGTSNGANGLREIPYDEIRSVGVERAATARLAGRPVVLVAPVHGDTVSAAVLGGAGFLSELVEQLDQHAGRAAAC